MASVLDDPSWLRCNDGTYKVYAAGWFPRYTICGPGGSVLGCAYTMWGARRQIRKHRAAPPLKFWEHPIVHSEPGDAA